MEKKPILSLKNVSKTFPVGKSLFGKPTKFVHAVNNVSFDVYEGEFLPENMKSIAIKIRYSSLEATLKDDQIKPVENAILSSLNKNFGAYLRS